jgi:ubiquinone/menaquinone biosynthesis C-methylase UbiE
MNFEKVSYNKHSQTYKEHINTDSSGLFSMDRYKNWFDRDTVDLRRHLKMFSVLNPFLKNEKGARWLTVGDGVYGTSAIYINKNGGKAIPTDLDTGLLEVAVKNFMISECKYANAENLPFEDNSFDYSYCKQAYHHFPRPFASVYEMLRVSKKAIILTEPADWLPSPFLRSMLKSIKHGAKRILGKTILHHDTGCYEPIGNYVYTIGEREIEKLAISLNCAAIAFKRFHDIYVEGGENELFKEKGPIYQQQNFILFKRKVMTAIGLIRPNNIQVVVFKVKPPDIIKNEFVADGYDFIELPQNPFL